MDCESCVQAQVVEQLPDHIDVGRENRSVCIDPCLLTAVRMLWEVGIDTRGHCCGHGKERASIIVSQEASMKQITQAKIIVANVFDVQFDILQWKLCSV